MSQQVILPKRLTQEQWNKLEKIRMRAAAIEQWKEDAETNAGVLSEIFGVHRSTFWRWRKRDRQEGVEGLLRMGRNESRRRVDPEIEQKILQLRRERGYGHQRIQLYLKRYEGVCLSSSTVWNVLKRNHMPPLYVTRYNKTAKPVMKRYEKESPGETVQMDVKFVRDPQDPLKRFYQFTALDDCTRYRVLRIYARNTTECAIDFLGHVRKAFPAVIQEIQTDNGPEFATDFSFYLDHQGIHHRLIRPRTPRLNGKVERSHRTDTQEFYAKQQFSDMEDLQKKVEEWERHYNHERAHMALDGRTPAEKLHEKLSTDPPSNKRCT